ncbi:adenosylcobalamin-dependent ribonucleoside-diphosphate reductase [Candidatus Woesearchaeota archaeon]|nr:adenosylcobalamin-dependent ribonucleoside-diphosphate reductase [Candidatus Woesearchaeota archaeon]
MSYKRNEAYKATLEYFNGDTLAADVWVNKYSLKDTVDGDTVYYELTPNDMHKRLAKELNRIENKYPNPLSEDFIFNLLKDFKYIIPQGSPMSGIGNSKQVVSLSNCFVVGENSDSYGSIMKIDEEQIQLMKRRGGVGHDLSHIRPKGSIVKNSALTSTGLVPFMERYSNSTREVAQDGRRGALMLSCSIKHPDSEDFIDAKLEKGKVTGANISVKVTDDFMKAALNAEKYTQYFPIDSSKPIITKEIEAKKLWRKIVHNAWKSAEPGVLFWDTVMSESVPDCYAEYGFKTVSTNPCGEITLCPYDSCRLLAVNLYSYVDNPFTSEAKFNFEKFKEHIIYAERFMDDIVDLEVEKINMILDKIERDPEPESVKRTEIDVWEKILKMTLSGRRTGLGVTAEGDMLAALGLRYGTKEATNFSEKVHRTLAINAYKSSCIMAKERGAFPVYNYEKELNNPFIQRLKKDDPELDIMLREFGRRNIALLTIAPTGSVSIMTQTTSGIEPAYLPKYKRRRKINPNDKSARVDYTDDEGVKWEEYFVFHHKFEEWLKINGYDTDKVKEMPDQEFNEIFEKSPYFKATSNDVDWVEKVRMQGKIQKYVDHSISVTVNLPNNVTEDIVSDVYETGWKSGCKGITVYRDGSRQGVIVANDKKDDIFENNAAKRPKRLECEVVRFTNNKEKWVGFLGLMTDDNGEKYPYEIFTGLLDKFYIPAGIDNGEIVRTKNGDKSRYDFVYKDKDGYHVTMEGLNRAFDREFWNVSKLLSAFLRHRIHLPSVINLIDSLQLASDTAAFGTWKSGVKRIIKKYINSIIVGEVCPKCGATSPELVYEQGCKSCKSCGWQKCDA